MSRHDSRHPFVCGSDQDIDDPFRDLKHSIKCLNQRFSLYNPRLVEREKVP